MATLKTYLQFSFMTSDNYVFLTIRSNVLKKRSKYEENRNFGQLFFQPACRYVFIAKFEMKLQNIFNYGIINCILKEKSQVNVILIPFCNEFNLVFQINPSNARIYLKKI